jgi:hypothetical protein
MGMIYGVSTALPIDAPRLADPTSTSEPLLVKISALLPAHTLATLDRLHELAAKSGTAACGCTIDLKLGGALYPNDADGARNLLSVAERKADGLNERWEESLRELLRADKPPGEAASGEEPERSSSLVRVRRGERRTVR